MPSEFQQLSDALEFVRNHDEHAGIASGDAVIDDSVDSELLDKPENLGDTAQKETTASEVKENSVIHQFLRATLRHIKKEIDDHKQPNCYRQGSFMIYAKHPVFVLHDTPKFGLQTDHLCHRNVFVWLPQCLPGAPDSFKCTCGGRLSKNGELF